MFQNKTAWFSNSCPDSARNLWVENGGKLEDVSLAQYVFSDNWDQNDTKILYNSDAYLKQHLAVFSSQYVIDAVQQGIDNMPVGKYFLIPSDIKDSINTRRVRATKLVRHESSIACPSSKNTQLTPLSKNKCGNRQQWSDCDSLSSPCFSSASSSAEVSSADKSQSLLHPSKNNDRRKASSSQNKAKEVANTVSSNKSVPLGSSFRENRTIDVESIPHVQSLPKVISCLRTICPGKDGVEVKPVT